MTEIIDRVLDDDELDAEDLAEDAAEDAAEGKPLPPRWRGIIAPLDTPSGDGRVIGTPHSGKIRVRPLPMPLLYQLVTGKGHENSVVVGDVDRVWRDGSYLMGEGRFDLGSKHGREAARQLRDGFHRWVSVLIDDETGEPACVNADGTYTTACAADCEHTNFYNVATDWRATSVTMVAEQAFPEATIKPVWEEADDEDEVLVEEIIAAGITAEERQKAAEDGAAMPGGRYPIRNEEDLRKAIHAVGRAGGPTGTSTDRNAVRRHIIKRARALGKADMIPDTWNSDGTLKGGEHALALELHGIEEDDCPCLPSAMVASAATVEAPPASWFADPKLEGPTPLTVTADGRVFGHLACWDSCHTSYAGRCVTPPKSQSGYAYFHTASIPVDDGSGTRPGLPVGLITLNTGHADIGDNHVRAMAHYDNTGTQAAAVRAGEDAFGIWVAGSVLPQVSEEDRATLARSPISGDWRVIGGKQELVAALSVNVPGFPVPRYRTDRDGQAYALVAAGVVPQAAPDLRTYTSTKGPVTVTVDAANLAKLVADELEAREERRAEHAATMTGYRAMVENYVQKKRRLQADVYAAAIHREDEGEEFELGPEFNWVEERGGLPPYIKRIAKHVPGDQSQKIATAINVVKKMCATGDVNWPGKQKVNMGSQAEACAAVARWEAMKGSK